MKDNSNFLSKKHNSPVNTREKTKSIIIKNLKYQSICKKCNQIFYDKYTLLFHLAYVHQQYDNLCRKCFGIFSLIDKHVEKCSLPLREEESVETIKKLMLIKKNKKNLIMKYNDLKEPKRSEQKQPLIENDKLRVIKEEKIKGVNNAYKSISINEKEELVTHFKEKKDKEIFDLDKEVKKIIDKDEKKNKKYKDINKDKITELENKKTNVINKTDKAIQINLFEDILITTKNNIVKNKSLNIGNNNDWNQILKICHCYGFSYKINRNDNDDNNKKKYNNIIKNGIDKKVNIKNNNIDEKNKINIESQTISEECKNFEGDKFPKLGTKKYINFKKNNSEIKENYLKVIKDYKIIDLNNAYFFVSDLIIGKGRYGQVNFGIKKKDFSGVAIKRQNKVTVNDYSAGREAGILQILEKSNLFPKIYDYIKEGSYYYYIETLQGPDLLKFFSFSNGIDVKTAYRIGIEIIINLQILHKFGFLHVDLKEDNIVSLRKPKIINSYNIHFILIDFGFSVQFQNKEGIHFDESSSKLKRCGNFYYASPNALLGKSISRKDDLISVVYLLLVWCCGCPWINIPYKCSEDTIRNKILEIKTNLNIQKLCEYKCEEVYKLYEKIKLLNFKDVPAYEEYIKILSSKLIQKNSIGNIHIFCWDEKIHEKDK